MSQLDARALLAIVAAVLEQHVDTAAAPPADALPARSDTAFVRRLLDGDERAFEQLVSELQPLLVRLAATVVRNHALAEEIVQDTWIAVLQGLPTFAGRSSLKTWIVRILFNRARSRAVREGRSVPFSALPGADDSEPAAFNRDGAWASPPTPWNARVTPERLLADAQARALVERAIETLPEPMRWVIELRDVAQLESSEVCELLRLSEANQRVLLHRARNKVRSALAAHLRVNDS